MYVIYGIIVVSYLGVNYEETTHKNRKGAFCIARAFGGNHHFGHTFLAQRDAEYGKSRQYRVLYRIQPHRKRACEVYRRHTDDELRNNAVLKRGFALSE